MMREYWTPERKKARKEAYNSEEYKQLQRTSKAKSMRIVSIGGVEYPGVRAAAEALGIGHMTVIQRLKSKTARFNSWQYKS